VTAADPEPEREREPARAPGPKSGARRRSRVVAAIVTAAVAAAGGGVFLGVRDCKTPVRHETHDPVGEPVCPVEEADKGLPCKLCRNAKCCPFYAPCRDSSACQDYLACIRKCDDSVCESKCGEDHDAGLTIAAPMLACVNGRCLGECTGKGHGNPCTDCVFSHCVDPAKNCLGDPACHAMYTCSAKCKDGDDACEQKCQEGTTLVTQDLYDALDSCGKRYCREPCR
jgi:hypothetical protein